LGRQRGLADQQRTAGKQRGERKEEVVSVQTSGLKAHTAMKREEKGGKRNQQQRREETRGEKNTGTAPPCPVGGGGGRQGGESKGGNTNTLSGCEQRKR